MKTFLFTFFAFALVTSLPAAEEEKKPQTPPLEIGAKAPDGTTVDQDGKPVNFAEIYKKGYTLVYFYPKADTGGCTAQACSIRDKFEKLTQKNIQVIGVSTDKAEAQKAFKTKHNLPFSLIPDTDHKVIDAFGVPLNKKSNATRMAFLIKDGVVVWRDLNPSTREQAESVLQAVAALESTPVAKEPEVAPPL